MIATVLRKQNITRKGAGKTVALSTRFHAQRPLSPPSSLQ